MNTPDSQEIVRRFFQALDRLKADKVIRGKQTFTLRYGINRWNMHTLQNNPASNIFQAAWLLYLVRDFHISPLWLIAGEGPFYAPGWDAPKVKNLLKNEPASPTPTLNN